MPTVFMSDDSAAPMENSPPGIHTMPGGDWLEAGRAFSTVDSNAATVDVPADACVREA
jgi:hypothetical protein